MKAIHRNILVFFVLGGISIMLFATHIFGSEEPKMLSPEDGGYSGPPYFNDYDSWQRGSLKETPLFRVLALLADYDYDGIYGSSTPQKYMIADFNGDSLSDFAFHSTSRSSSTRTSYVFLALYLNNGNNTFSKVYKCVYETYRGEYYGDCAQGSTSTYEPNAKFSLLIPYAQARGGSGKEEPRASYMDINGDGLIDIIGDNYYAYMNKGNLEFEYVPTNF